MADKKKKDEKRGQQVADTKKQSLQMKQQSKQLSPDLNKLKTHSFETDEQYQASIIERGQDSCKFEMTNQMQKQKNLRQNKKEKSPVKNETPKGQKNSKDSIEKYAEKTAIQMENFQFIQFDVFEKIQKAIFICGQSRIGKSALFLLLNDILLQPKKKVPVTIDVSQGSPYYQNIIGHGGDIKTKLPNIRQILLTPQDKNEKNPNDSIHIIDCPGFIDDGKGIQNEFINKYYINKVFNIVQQARFILCMQESDITNNNRASLAKTLTGFLKLFKNDTPNLNKIIYCTTIIITKTNNLSQGNQTLDDYVEDIVQYFQSHDKNNQARIIQKINEQKRVYYLPQARKNEQSYQPGFGKKFRQEEIKKGFYRIKHIQDIVFEFDQNDASEAAKEKREQFLQIYQYTNRKVIEMCDILLSAYKQISDNSIKGSANNPKKFQFIKKIQNYVFNQDIYESRSELLARKIKLQSIMKKFELKEEEKDFAQIMFLRKMAILYNKLIEINIKINNDNYQDIIFGYLDNILNYGYIDKDCSGFYNFAYILKRRLNQIKIIQKIRPKVIENQYIDIMAALSDNDFDLEKKEQQFIMNFKLKSNTYDQNYLKFAEVFFEKKIYNKQQPGLKQLEDKRKQQLIAILFERATLFQTKQDFKGAFIQYEKCRLLTELHNKQKNSGKRYAKVNVQLYKRLGQICAKKFQAYFLAIEYYKVIEFNQSILRCFDLKLASLKTQKTLIYLQYATFLGSICQVAKAKQLLEQAYEGLEFNKSNQFEMVIKIKSLIRSLINTQTKVRDEYVSRIQSEDIYNRPDQKKILIAMEMEMPELYQTIKNFKAGIEN